MARLLLLPVLAVGAMYGGAASAEHLNIMTDGLTVDGDTLTFQSVLIDQDGYIVIHATEGDQPVLPGSVGHAAVPAGETSDVAVTVEDLQPGTYYAMIHYETNGNGTYDFGEGMTEVDTPGMRPDGTPYMVPFAVEGM